MCRHELLTCPVLHLTTSLHADWTWAQSLCGMSMLGFSCFLSMLARAEGFVRHCSPMIIAVDRVDGRQRSASVQGLEWDRWCTDWLPIAFGRQVWRGGPHRSKTMKTRHAGVCLDNSFRDICTEAFVLCNFDK